MPNRAQILTAGPADTEPGTTCGICYREMQLSHPVRLPCCNTEHIFCRKCIMPWLQKHNRCIYECDVRPWDAAPWTDIDEALLISTAETLKFTNLDTSDVEQLGGCRAMDWQSYLRSRREPTASGTPIIFYQQTYMEITGPGRVVAEQLLLSTMTLANAIPLLVANSPGKTAYTPSERRDWQAVVDTLLTILPSLAEMVQAVEKMPYLLRKKIEFKFSSGDVSTPRFLQTDHPRSEDLDLLLDNLAATAFLARVSPSGAVVNAARPSKSVS